MSKIVNKVSKSYATVTEYVTFEFTYRIIEKRLYLFAQNDNVEFVKNAVKPRLINYKTYYEKSCQCYQTVTVLYDSEL